MGRPVYRDATSPIIIADAGGSNGARPRLRKWLDLHGAHPVDE
jgi:hypothetical protein